MPSVQHLARVRRRTAAPASDAPVAQCPLAPSSAGCMAGFRTRRLDSGRQSRSRSGLQRRAPSPPPASRPPSQPRARHPPLSAAASEPRVLRRAARAPARCRPAGWPRTAVPPPRPQPLCVELLHFAQLGARATALGCAALELLVSTETVRLPPIAVHQRARVVLLPPVLAGASRVGVLASFRAPRAPRRRARPPTLQRELRRAACARRSVVSGAGELHPKTRATIYST